MTLSEKKRVLIDYLSMKVLQADWHGVSDAANDLREIELEIRIRSGQAIYLDAQPSNPGPPTAAAVPPVELEIPHHQNEVLGLLKLSDEQLVDKMFPELEPETMESE